MNRETPRPTSSTTGLLFISLCIIAFLSFACSNAQTENKSTASDITEQQDEWTYSWEVVFSDGESRSWQRKASIVTETAKELDFAGSWQQAEDHTQVFIRTMRTDTSQDHYEGKRLIVSRGDGVDFSVERIILKKPQEGCYFGRLLGTEQLILIRLFREGAECKNAN